MFFMINCPKYTNLTELRLRSISGLQVCTTQLIHLQYAWGDLSCNVLHTCTFVGRLLFTSLSVLENPKIRMSSTIFSTPSGSSTNSCMVHCHTISSSFSLMCFRKANGAQLSGCTTGGTASSMIMWYSPGRSHKPYKTSLYSSKRNVIPAVAAIPEISSRPLEFDTIVLSQSLTVTSPRSIQVLYDNSVPRSSSVMLKSNAYVFLWLHFILYRTFV